MTNQMVSSKHSVCLYSKSTSRLCYTFVLTTRGSRWQDLFYSTNKPRYSNRLNLDVWCYFVKTFALFGLSVN